MTDPVWSVNIMVAILLALTIGYILYIFKLAKEETNNLEESLKDFPAIKAELDKAFMEIKSDKDNELLNKRIDEIKKKFPNNPFIEEYTRMMNFQIRIKYVQDELLKYNDDLYQNEEDLKEITNAKGETVMHVVDNNDHLLDATMYAATRY